MMPKDENLKSMLKNLQPDPPDGPTATVADTEPPISLESVEDKFAEVTNMLQQVVAHQEAPQEPIQFPISAQFVKHVRVGSKLGEFLSTQDRSNMVLEFSGVGIVAYDRKRPLARHFIPMSNVASVTLSSKLGHDAEGTKVYGDD